MTKDIYVNYYLINLDKAEDRLKFMEMQFEEKNIPFERISAVYGKQTKENIDYKIKNKYYKYLNPAEIGCYLSHLKALKKIATSDSSFGIILEDDAILCENFKDIIELFLLDYKNLNDSLKWDVLKLYNNGKRNIQLKKIGNNNILAHCGTSIPSMTIGAIWTKEGAKKFLSKIYSENREIPIVSRPIDCELQFPWEFNLTILNLLPSPITISDFETQIQYNFSKKRYPKLFYEVHRAFYKVPFIIKNYGLKSFVDSFILKKNEIIL